MSFSLEKLIFPKKAVLICLAHTEREHSAFFLKKSKESVRRAWRGRGLRVTSAI